MRGFEKLRGLTTKGQELIGQVKFARLFFKIVNNPNDTTQVFKLSDIVYNEIRKQNPREVSKYLRSSEVYRQALEERYMPALYQIEDLAVYAPGTLGHVYYRHMTTNGFQKDFYTPVKLSDDLAYIEQRLRETHDIWHVMTGYGTDVLGEASLLAFYLAQARNEDPFPMIIIAAGAAYMALHDRATMGRYIQGIYEGYNRGLAASNFYPVKWEELWDRPLAEIQAMLNVSSVVPEATLQAA
ncbi:MAG TPA: Coq4 family protein [Chloroflexia bacterium]|nr:Coq4 family protein [Chloroflexia bacterium]